MVPSFVGTFPANGIPNVKQRPASFVVNYDSDGEPGSHWVAILLLPHGNAEFMDSFGFPPLQKDIRNYLEGQSKSYIYNCKQLQHNSATTCGRYAVHFI